MMTNVSVSSNSSGHSAEGANHPTILQVSAAAVAAGQRVLLIQFNLFSLQFEIFNGLERKDQIFKECKLDMVCFDVFFLLFVHL